MQVLVVTTSARSSWFDVARSTISSWHPEATVRPIVADGRLLSRPPDGAVLPQSLHVGPVRYVDLVMAFGATGATWASLPWILTDLELGELADGELIVVMSDTIEVFGRLDPLLSELGHRSASARSAHRDVATGLPWGGCLPGFVAWSADGGDAMAWWRARVLAELSTTDVDGVDQAASATLDWLWRDLPIGDAVAGVADPSVRLAAATTGELDVRVDDTTAGGSASFTVAGEALLMADLDGLDPTRPWWFAADGAAPRRLTSESPGLRALLHLAARRLQGAGWKPGPDELIGPVPGLAVTAAVRRWYRELLASHLAPGRADCTLPPNPYVAGEVGGFLDLLARAEDAGVTGISLHADLVIAQRPDLRAAFPAVRWSGRDDFVRWMWTHGLREQSTSLALLPDLPGPRPRHTEADGPRPFGVNLIGYLTGELGLGVAARRMKSALETAGIPVATVSYDRTSSRRQQASDRILDAPYLFNLLVITPDQLPFFVEDVGRSFLAGHHNIGLWYWETDVLTDRQISSFEWVDEVWGATEYMCRTFERYDRVPVRHVPVPLVFDDPLIRDGDRERLGLDERFTVLFSFDFLSVVDRKNPLGLVEAFCRAFEPADGARLILKGINGEVFPDKLEQLLDAAADRPDIDVWDRYLSSRDRLALVALADCYASLHRSEGLGLTMAEAMALGTPVVATAYSGNLDFMDERTALLVPAEEVLIGEGSLYPADGHWADPDLDVAAAHLRRLFSDAGLRARLTADGPTALQAFGVREVAEVVARRLDELGTTA